MSDEITTELIVQAIAKGFKELEKNFEDQSEAAEGLTETLEDTADAAEDLADASGEAEKKGKGFREAMKDGKMAMQSFNMVMGIGKAALAEVAASADRLGRTELGDNMDSVGESVNRAKDTLLTLNIGGRDTIAWVSDAAAGLNNLVKVIDIASVAWLQQKGAISDAEASQRAYAIAFKPVPLTFDQLAQAQKDAADPMDESNKLLRAQTDELLRTERAAKDLNTAQSNLATIIAGPVGQELDSYNQKQSAVRDIIMDTQAKIDGLNAKSYLTPAQKEELDGLTQTLGDQKQVYADNATAHEQATARIVFDFIQQAYAADGLSLDEIAALGKIGQAWGIYDQETATAIDAATKAVQDHGTDVTGILTDVEGKVKGLTQDDWILNFHIEWSPEELAALQAAVNNATGEVNGQVGGATGDGYDDPNAEWATGTPGWMTVPPGYPNDRYRVGLSSGETYYVAQPGAPVPGAGDTINNITNTNIFNDHRSTAMYLADQRRKKLARADALMGA